MKLSRHQKEIIKKIIAGEVYDIQSYLHVFSKCHTEKYDMTALRKAYESAEEGKTYKVLKEGYSLLTSGPAQTLMGATYHLPQMRLHIPEEEYELKPSLFIESAPRIKYVYDEKEYEFDFIKGVDVISSFDEVLEFLTLWSYLSQENLILEVSKPIHEIDVGMFFEKVILDTPQKKPEIKIEIDGIPLKSVNACDVLSKAPERFAYEYSNVTWKINEENLLVCKEFLGKKIVRTSLLISFFKKKFKTKEQVAQDSNYRVALIALIISVISIIMSNVVPLFQKQPADYLDDISQQLTAIEIQLTDVGSTLSNGNDTTETNIANILTTLQEIENSVKNINGKNATAKVEEILQEISEIKQLLSGDEGTN